jgi:hypothetical protein
MHGQLRVGRIRREAALKSDTQWICVVSVYDGPEAMRRSGMAATIEEAQAALEVSWQQWLAWAGLSTALQESPSVAADLEDDDPLAAALREAYRRREAGRTVNSEDIADNLRETLHSTTSRSAAIRRGHTSFAIIANCTRDVTSSPPSPGPSCVLRIVACVQAGRRIGCTWATTSLDYPDIVTACRAPRRRHSKPPNKFLWTTN